MTDKRRIEERKRKKKGAFLWSAEGHFDGKEGRKKGRKERRKGKVTNEAGKRKEGMNVNISQKGPIRARREKV